MEKARLQNYTVYFENSSEYHRVRREVWGENTYYCEFDKEKPVIVDAGAHIGLTTLYYKRLYPLARVIAIEPQPTTAEILRKNVWENQLEGVEVVEAALSDSEGEEKLYYDKSKDKWFSTAGFTEGAWNKEQESEAVWVKTKKLSDLLIKEKPDLVKLDIEGMEERVLREARTELKLCPHYLIEWHPVRGNELKELVTVLEGEGLRVEITKDGKRITSGKVRGLCMVEATRMS